MTRLLIINVTIPTRKLMEEKTRQRLLERRQAGDMKRKRREERAEEEHTQEVLQMEVGCCLLRVIIQ